MEEYVSIICVTLFTIYFLGVLSQTSNRFEDARRKRETCDFRWSVWSEFSLCSRSCGLGIKSRHRTCYEYGPVARPVQGENCKGITRDYQTCNTQACPMGTRDFRQLQCSFFNGKQYKQHGYQWTTFRSGVQQGSTDPCALMCAAEGYSGIVVKFSQRVVDGTQCESNSYSVCVAGTCVPIGCDNRTYSNKTVDRCGVCGGRNDTCHTVTRSIAHRVPNGYTELLRIPVGTRYIRVTERPRSGVILSLKNARDVFVINGRRLRDHRTETMLMAGTIVYYSHSKRGLENIRAEGPLNEAIIIMVSRRLWSVGGCGQLEVVVQCTECPAASPENQCSARRPSIVSLVYEYTIPNIGMQNKNRHKKPVQTESSYPWQSLLYQNVLTGRVLFGPTPPELRTPVVSMVTSTVKPSCRGHVDGGHVSEHSGHGRHSNYTDSRIGQRRFPHVKKDHRNPGVQSSYETYPSNSNRNARHPRNRNVEHVQRRGFKKRDPISKRAFSPQREPSKLEPFSSMFKLKTSRSVFYTPKHSRSDIKSSRRTFQTVVKKQHFTKGILKSRTGSSKLHSSSMPEPSKHQKRPIQEETTMPTLDTPATEKPTSESSIPEVTDKTMDNVSVTLRTPVEASTPTYMPRNGNQDLREDLTMYGEDTDSEEALDEKPELNVNVSVQIAARNNQKAEKRRRGKDRGRKRKKIDRNRVKYYWRANAVTPCTSTCEVGTEMTLFSCYQSNGDRVDDSLCEVTTKPPPAHHMCASKTCKPRWVAGLWSECSKSCGEGRQLRSARCWQMMALGFDSTVRDFTCNPTEKPQTVRACHKLASCRPQWEMAEWEKCSTECGYGVELRHVRCSVDNEADCGAGKRPLDRRPCRNRPCVNQWYTLPWSSCSGMCGIRMRKVFCRDNQGRVVDDRKCNYNTKPLTAHACGRCKNKWVPQEWGKCSVTCDDGVTSRRVVCGTSRNGRFQIRSDSFCVQEVKPPTITNCRNAPCGATWYTTDWSECSETCGTSAKHYRDVRCYGGPETELCDVNNRPIERDVCKLPPCETDKACTDDGDTRCDLVVSAKLCSHKYYRKACCHTCSVQD